MFYVHYKNLVLTFPLTVINVDLSGASTMKINNFVLRDTKNNVSNTLYHYETLPSHSNIVFNVNIATASTTIKSGRDINATISCQMERVRNLIQTHD